MTYPTSNTSKFWMVAVHCFDLGIRSMEAEVVAYWIFTGWFMVDTQLFKSLNPGRSLAMVLGSRSFTASSRLVQRSTTAWWFGTWILLFHILAIILPTDFHIFQRGKSTTRYILTPFNSPKDMVPATGLDSDLERPLGQLSMGHIS
jgi:hypothetical protein